MEKYDSPKIIEFPKITDLRGNLSFVQNGDSILPFDVARVFWTYDVPAGEIRGGHAHRIEQQVLIAMSGSFNVNLFDGVEWKHFLLNRPYQALYIPSGYWRTMDGFSSGAICAALSSILYDEGDYIRDFDEFLKIRRQK